MLSCRELVEQADALLARELPWRQRLFIRIHLITCHHCRRYLRQLRWLITALFHRHGTASHAEVTQVMSALPSTAATTRDS